VIAAICGAGMPVWISRAILCVITRVLPEPAPASTRQGPVRKFTASCCARFRPVEEAEVMREIEGVLESGWKRLESEPVWHAGQPMLPTSKR